MEWKQGLRLWWIAAAVTAADRLSKAAAMRLKPGSVRTLIPGVMNLRLTVNSGMAFSLLSGRSGLLCVLTAALTAGMLIWLLGHPKAPGLMRSGLWLALGGGLGNLYDRLTRGEVIDFLEPAFVRFAVFNVADACICIGAVLIAAALCRDLRRKEGDRIDGGI